MNGNTLNTPKSHDELAAKINQAVNSGNHDELDRLMAVEIPDEPVVEEPEEQEETLPEETPDDTVTEDEPSNDGSDEEKEETAEDVPAVSTPEDKAKEQPVEDASEKIARLERELHTFKSDAGRVPYMQRRLQELERELRDTKLSRKAEDAVKTAQPDTPATRDIPENLKKKIAALRDIDPDLADTLEEGFKASITATGPTVDAAKVAKDMIQDAFRQQDEAKEQEFIQQQFDTLVSRVPQAPQIFKTPEWQQWKDTLTPGRRALAESMYADEVQIAIGAFVQDMQAKFGKPNANSNSAPVTKQPSAEDTAVGERVRESRERKLEAQTDAKGVAAKGTKPKLSEEEQFANFYAQIRKDSGY